MNIVEVATDPEIFGAEYSKPSWRAWLGFLRVVFGLPLEHGDLERFREHTGRSEPAKDGYKEIWMVCGRRAGKSSALALVAVFLAAFCDWSKKLGRGERGVVMVVAADRKQADQILGFVRGLLSVDMLARTVTRETSDRIEIGSDVAIEVVTCSFRSVRGRSAIAILADEAAFWMSDHSANPDKEVIGALRPSLATTGGMLFCASSPHARKGILWEAYDRWYGKDVPQLVWRAPTRSMNEVVTQEFVDAALAEDYSFNAAEYLAQFRDDLEQFVRAEVIKDCTGGYEVRHPDSSLRYYAFCDPSGGSGADSFALSIGHREKLEVHVDLVTAVRPPFVPSAVIDELCDILRSYRITEVRGDRFAGEFPREHFSRNGVRYVVSAKNKGELYQGLLPALNSRRITIPKDELLINQLLGLERRARAGGRETIDHRPGAHDDLANCVAGVNEVCVIAGLSPPASFGRYGTPDDVGAARAAMGWGGQGARKSKFDGVIESGPLKGGFATSTKVRGLIPGDEGF